MTPPDTSSPESHQAAESDSQWTYKRLLSWTTDFLKERGSDSPQLDGQVLLAHAAGCNRLELFTAYDKVASEETRATFRGLVKRRADGEPVAYLVGSREFYSLPFQVTSDVLIPRPETEHLVVALLDKLKERGEHDLIIADIGTGSGCIAIAAAKHASHCRFLAVDKSEAALTVAAANAKQHGVDDRIEFVHGDLLDAVPRDLQLDFIVSNPPYVSEVEFAELAPDVRDHEPRTALVAGPTGAEVIERLLRQAAERLKPGGWVFVEISPMIEQRVLELVASIDGLDSRQTIKDLAGHVRVIQAERV
ncbi:MAG: peptide chain release factor N(5)-glutamine methyltransferase [Pirellulales bacterium]|nr:peptide chain release factor N(5)-glutamine methyltransferase [Pirellulales bacterium]